MTISHFTAGHVGLLDLPYYCVHFLLVSDTNTVFSDAAKSHLYSLQHTQPLVVFSVKFSHFPIFSFSRPVPFVNRSLSLFCYVCSTQLSLQLSTPHVGTSQHSKRHNNRATQRINNGIYWQPF